MSFPFSERIFPAKSEKQGIFFFVIAERSEALAGLLLVRNF
jgi:hypothetical protein